MSQRVYVPPVNPGQIPPPSRDICAIMGEANILRMIEDFYRELEQSSLRDLFPADVVAASRKSAAFFVGLLGGPPLYQQRFGNPMMRARHLAFVITRGRARSGSRASSACSRMRPGATPSPNSTCPAFARSCTPSRCGW